MRLFIAAIALLLPLAASAADIAVKSPWVRASLIQSEVTAGYLEITNSGKTDDALVAASSPVAGRVEIHTMKMDGGIMQMRKLEKLDVPAGKTVALAPGGDHLMFFELKQTLKKGESVPVTLTFKKSGEQKISAVIKSMDEATVGGHSHH
jgi:copper(I)-binding protein